jgi:hypothetical protein
MTVTQPTPEQINDLAMQLHRQRSPADIVPWSELPESLKESLLQMAEQQLNAA